MNPSQRRICIVATIFIATICNYLDRQLLSILKPEILTHFGIDDVAYAWIVNVFLVCYAIMYPISGILVDKFGPRKVMFIGILGWSIACIGGGISQNAVQFAICRGVLGLAEPTIFAGEIVAISLWFERRQRATANSICQAGGSLGTILAPVIIAWLSNYLPWYEVFILAGVVGVVISFAWALIYHEPSQEVLAQTQDTPAADGAQFEKSFSWGKLWSTRSLWGCILFRLIGDPVWYFCCFWLPGFLRSMGEANGLDQHQTLNMIQWIGGIPFLVGAIGGVLVSALSDKLVHRGTPALKARKVVMIGSVILSPLCALTPFVAEWTAVSFDMRLALVIIIFSLIAIMCLTWLYNTATIISDAFPVKNVASVLGICCGAGAVGGAIFNVFVGSLLATMGNVIFFTLACLYPICSILTWKLIRRETVKG
jgi:ACS family hexuronate transporter-like MFS transporter